MEVDQCTAKKLEGRGEVKIITAKPNIGTNVEKDSSMRDAEMYKAIEYLRQARRREQINHRLARSREAEPSVKEKYNVLNKTTITEIKKGLGLKDGDVRGFEAELHKFTNNEKGGAMLGPTLKLQMCRFQKRHDTWKRRSMEKMKRWHNSGVPSEEKGQWDLRKHMVSNVQSKPLIALKTKYGAKRPTQRQRHHGPERDR